MKLQRTNFILSAFPGVNKKVGHKYFALSNSVYYLHVFSKHLRNYTFEPIYMQILIIC